MTKVSRSPRRGCAAIVSGIGIGTALGALLGMAVPASAAPAARACAQVASALQEACRSDVRSDFATARAVCLDLPDAAARASCMADAKAARADDSDGCKEQRDARRDLCDALGGGPYAPEFAPADFDTDFADPPHPNPYFPLKIGDEWTYVSGDQTDHVQVVDETKSIEGVTCVVSRDQVSVAGNLIENTDDWIAQKKDTAVFYCGEIAQSLELFPGDDPATPELVDIEGSWKAGRDGARPGILFQAAPAVGQVYRQEFAPGTAEDSARVVSTTYSFGSAPDLDQLVPQALADLLCGAADCVVTEDFSATDPGDVERKYYAKGIGIFLEVTPATGEIVQLVDCNVDERCGSLPTP